MKKIHSLHVKDFITWVIKTGGKAELLRSDPKKLELDKDPFVFAAAASTSNSKR